MLMNYWNDAIAAVRNSETLPRRRGNTGTRSLKPRYRNIICAFDIETTRLVDIEQSIMYVWQCQIDTVTVFGRTWEEYTDFINAITADLECDEKLVFFVHNLSYEFQFLSGVFDFGKDDVFATSSRRVVKATSGKIEYRCSYIHSNMSLAEYLLKMGVKHRKLSGDDFDYSKIRYPWTPLTDYEKEYCANDVRGLVEAIKIEMKHDGDNLNTFPLTSTGYVRRDCKKALRKISHKYMPAIKPDYDLYKILREAFRGGNTHASRFYAGQILHDVNSCDRSSSYPDVMVNCEFPTGTFYKVSNPTVKKLTEYMGKKHRAVVARLCFKNIDLRVRRWGCPYLSRDKCRNIIKGVFDNGRILCADYLELTATDVDLRIIFKEYRFTDFGVSDMYTARYGLLPKPYIDLINEYYRRKTVLKGDKEQEIFYMKSKNKLNSLYGMSAQDPGKMHDLYVSGEWCRDESETPEEVFAKANRTAVLPYQWGVWVTAWARYRLEQGLDIVGDGFVYADTDSVKYIGNADFSDFNEKCVLSDEKTGAFADDVNGERHYMGVYEEEEQYCTFKTLGAKKYAYTYEDGKTHITVAGVGKRKGAEELEKAGGLNAFKEGFVFVDGGGTESVYNDADYGEYQTEDRHDIYIGKNIVIRPSTYTLGITAEYARLLEDPYYDNPRHGIYSGK